VPTTSPRYVGTVFDHWRPSLAMFIESDCGEPDPVERRAAAAMVLINGRMSQRSLRAGAASRGPSRRCFGKFTSPGAIAEGCGSLYRAGSRNVVVTGNLKLDVPAPPADATSLNG